MSIEKNQSRQSRELVEWCLQLMGLIKNCVTGQESASDDQVLDVCY